MLQVVQYSPIPLSAFCLSYFYGPKFSNPSVLLFDCFFFSSCLASVALNVAMFCSSSLLGVALLKKLVGLFGFPGPSFSMGVRSGVAVSIPAVCACWCSWWCCPFVFGCWWALICLNGFVLVGGDFVGSG